MTSGLYAHEVEMLPEGATVGDLLTELDNSSAEHFRTKLEGALPRVARPPAPPLRHLGVGDARILHPGRHWRRHLSCTRVGPLPPLSLKACSVPQWCRARRERRPKR
jgi:hypothetical protein